MPPHADGLSLRQTCAPVAWAAGRWPNVDWIDGSLVWVGWEGERTVWRRAYDDPYGCLRVSGSADPELDARWGRRVLGIIERCPDFQDPVLIELRTRLPGLRPFAAGSLFDGLVSSIIGQSISIRAAAVAEMRLAALFHSGVEVAERRYWPAPKAEQLADATAELVRRSGVTWRRAEALVAVGRAFAQGMEGALDRAAWAEPDAVRVALRRLPLVGPWTVESALLWGIGLADAYPTGDVALLRAARVAYNRPELDGRALDLMAEEWRPGRGWAARLLWTNLLGVAPGSTAGSR